MEALSLPEETIKKVIDDPSILANPSVIQLTSEQVMTILDRGYTRGFRSVFILNAGLSAVATITSILLIKHKNLTREDDAKFREAAEGEKRSDEEQGREDKEGEGEQDSEKEKVGTSSGMTDHEHSDAAEPSGKTSSTPGGSSDELSETLCQDHTPKDGGKGDVTRQCSGP